LAPSKRRHAIRFDLRLALWITPQSLNTGENQRILSYIAQSRLATAYEFGERLLELAQQQQDAALILEAHRDIGTSLLFLGEQITASQHFAQGHQYNKKQSSPTLTILHGQGTEEAILLGYQAWNLWLRGYPDQALLTMNQALHLVQSHDSIQNFTLSSAQYFTLLSSAILHQWRRGVINDLW
jgi:tetratricopeptide (TPR) repeat protein